MNKNWGILCETLPWVGSLRWFLGCFTIKHGMQTNCLIQFSDFGIYVVAKIDKKPYYPYLDMFIYMCLYILEYREHVPIDFKQSSNCETSGWSSKDSKDKLINHSILGVIFFFAISTCCFCNL